MPEGDLKINTSVDASGVQAGVDQTVSGLNRVETATDAAAQAAKEAGQATTASATQSAEAAKTMADGVAGAADATQNLGEISEQTSAKLARLQISEEQVSAAAQKVGASLEVTAQAMIQIKSAGLSDEIARVREELEALGDQGVTTTAGFSEGIQGATGSTDDLSASIEDVGEGMESTEHKGAELRKELGSMRESRRIAIELFETMQGGGDTILGLTGMMRTLIVTSESLDPLVGILLGVSLALTGIIAKQEWSKKAKDDTDKLTTSTEAYKESLDALLGPEAALERSDEHQLAALKEKQGLTEKQIELDQRAAIEKARTAYLVAYGAAQSQEERKRLTQQFEATNEDIKASSEVASAKLSVKSKEEDIASTQKGIADAQQSMAGNQSELGRIQDAGAEGKNFLALMGITFNQKGEPVHSDGSDPIKQLHAKIDEDEKLAQAENAAKVASTPVARDKALPAEEQQAVYEQGLAAQLDAKAKLAQIDADTLLLAKVQNAIQATQDYAEAQKILPPKIQKQGESIDEARAKLDSQEIEYVQAQQALTIATTQLANDRTKSAIDLKLEALTEADAKAKANSEYAQKQAKLWSESERLKKASEHKTSQDENKDFDKDLSRVASEATALVRESKHPALEEELKNLLAAAKNDPNARILALLQTVAQTMTASHGKNEAWARQIEKELQDLEARVTRQAH